MGERRRLVVAAVVSSVLAVLLVPNTLLWIERAVGTLVGRTFDALQDPAARPVVLGIVLMGLLVLSFLVIFWFVRLFTSVGAKQGSRLSALYDRITPDSPRTKGLAFMLVFTVVFFVGTTLFVPWFADSLTDDGLNRVVDDVQEGEYGGDLERLFADDAVTPEGPTVGYREDDVDSDGDGLPDDWERAGQTPGGEPLPGSGPGQMDLYVQLNYGEETPALTDSERRSLKEIWASMPVDNPNGSRGIDLHLVTDRPGAGEMNERALADGKFAVDQYYTEEYLGPRYCLYHQVVLGDISDSDDIGYAESPGRAVILDGRRFSNYEGDTPFRAVMITHGLLHTVVGEVDGNVHTDGGWLDHPDRNNERLTDAAASKLERDGFATSQTYRQECSDRAV